MSQFENTSSDRHSEQISFANQNKRSTPSLRLYDPNYHYKFQSKMEENQFDQFKKQDFKPSIKPSINSKSYSQRNLYIVNQDKYNLQGYRHKNASYHNNLNQNDEQQNTNLQNPNQTNEVQQKMIEKQSQLTNNSHNPDINKKSKKLKDRPNNISDMSNYQNKLKNEQIEKFKNKNKKNQVIDIEKQFAKKQN